MMQESVEYTSEKIKLFKVLMAILKLEEQVSNSSYLSALNSYPKTGLYR